MVIVVVVALAVLVVVVVVVVVVVLLIEAVIVIIIIITIIIIIIVVVVVFSNIRNPSSLLPVILETLTVFGVQAKHSLTLVLPQTRDPPSLIFLSFYGVKMNG